MLRGDNIHSSSSEEGLFPLVLLYRISCSLGAFTASDWLSTQGQHALNRTHPAGFHIILNTVTKSRREGNVLQY